MYKPSSAVLLISLLVIINSSAGILGQNVTLENVSGKVDNATMAPVQVDPEPIPTVSTSPSPITKHTTTPITKPTTKSTTTAPTTPSTTTPSPTTPSTTTPSTTTPSTTTTTVPPTTPPSTTAAPSTTPKPNPKPEVGTWSVESSANHSCIVVKMAAIIDAAVKINNITYEGQIFLPKAANVTGVCGNDTQTMTLSWAYSENVTDSLEFVFKKNKTKFDLDSFRLNVTLDKEHFNNNGTNATVMLVHQKMDFETPVTMSYKCDKMQKLNVTLPASNDTVGSLTISSVQFQAFGNMTDMKFASAKDCEPYETPDVVPIAVGCALIALIVFVLIGYLIGRRRNQARGYLSM